MQWEIYCSVFKRHTGCQNGVHQSLFPNGGACVLLVIRFQDGGRRRSVVSAESKKNIYYVEMHRQMVEKLTWLNGTYYTENQSMRFMFVTFQYYCICWMSKLLRRKYSIIKLWWRISFSQFECVFVTGLKRQDQVNLLYLMIFIIIEKKIEVNCLYKARWDSLRSTLKFGHSEK